MMSGCVHTFRKPSLLCYKYVLKYAFCRTDLPSNITFDGLSVVFFTIVYLFSIGCLYI